MQLHEERIIALFVRKEKRERMLFLGARPARRSELVDALLHDTRSLDRLRLVALGATETEIAGIASRLRVALDAPAHCISHIDEIDGRELPLGDALRACVGRQRDTIVFCIAAERAYYENHEGERFVLATK